MPELPEVEMMRRRLSVFDGWKIHSVDVSGMPESRRMSDDERFRLVDSKINQVRRYGKMLVFVTDHGNVFSHNAMSGYWDEESDPWTFDYVEGKRKASETDVRARILIYNGSENKTLRFHDSRKFGSLRWRPVDDFSLVPGPDALVVTDPILFDLLLRIDGAKKSRPIKEILMDQCVISGIGNIYSVEMLWEAQINPSTLVSSLSLEDTFKLWEGMLLVLRRALEKELRYEEYIKCYRRKDCVRCGDKINKIDIAGRSTYFCGGCQV